MYGEINLINDKFIQKRAAELEASNKVEKKYFEKYDVKRGLRNADGTGVLAGITNICNVQGYIIQDDEKVPIEGRYTYRGIDVRELIDGFTRDKRFGYEETAYLLLFGSLPVKSELEQFKHAKTILLYAPTAGEVNVLPLLPLPGPLLFPLFPLPEQLLWLLFLPA